MLSNSSLEIRATAMSAMDGLAFLPLGINVTELRPGLTRTERTAGLVAEAARQQGITEAEAEERMAQGVSVRRIIDAREIAHVVAFLASPKSIAINGDVIAVAGGSGRAIHY